MAVSVLSLVALGVLVWAIVGLVQVLRARARRT
jgi:hypothetical protein